MPPGSLASPGLIGSRFHGPSTRHRTLPAFPWCQEAAATPVSPDCGRRPSDAVAPPIVPSRGAPLRLFPAATRRRFVGGLLL